MKQKCGNRSHPIKRSLTRLLVLFFVVYALADSTVLQAYCGNEAIGIPPAEHVTAVKTSCEALSETTAVIHSDQHMPPEHDTDQGCHDECLGSCAHIVIGQFVVELTSFGDIEPSTKAVFFQSQYTHSDTAYLFHPPRTA